MGASKNSHSNFDQVESRHRRSDLGDQIWDRWVFLNNCVCLSGREPYALYGNY